MKVLFLLDNNEYVEVDPTDLQLRQLAPNQAAIGIVVTRPKLDADGKAIEGELQQVFRPFVNYGVNLNVVTETVPSETPANAVAKDVAEVKQRSKKKNMKVPAAN